MQRLEVSGAVRHIYMSLGVKGLSTVIPGVLLKPSLPILYSLVRWKHCFINKSVFRTCDVCSEHVGQVFEQFFILYLLPPAGGCK
jgi:hypothetical protein